MDDPGAARPLAEPGDPSSELPGEGRGTEGRPSRWLVLAFVALLSILALLGTTGIGAAASTLLGGGPYDCGGG